MILLKQMIIFFAIMLVGVIANKKKLVTSEGCKVLSAIVVNIANPALILSASINKDATVQGSQLLIVAGLAIGVYIFLIIFSFIIIKILRMKQNESSTYQVMTVFSNIGFMGFPMISATYGTEALLYASFFLIPYNVLIYTWGIRMMSKNSEVSNNKLVLSKIFNIGVIACVVTIIIYLLRIPMPSIFESIITSLSNITAPLSMIVIGVYLANMGLKRLVSDKKLILFAVIKQIVVPLLGVYILELFNIESAYVAVCMVMLATPVGSMTAMLAEQYNGDYELASRGVALSTVISMGTMPLVAMVCGI